MSKMAKSRTTYFKKLIFALARDLWGDQTFLTISYIENKTENPV